MHKSVEREAFIESMRTEGESRKLNFCSKGITVFLETYKPYRYFNFFDVQKYSISNCLRNLKQKREVKPNEAIKKGNRLSINPNGCVIMTHTACYKLPVTRQIKYCVYR